MTSENEVALVDANKLIELLNIQLKAICEQQSRDGISSSTSTMLNAVNMAITSVMMAVMMAKVETSTCA